MQQYQVWKEGSGGGDDDVLPMFESWLWYLREDKSMGTGKIYLKHKVEKKLISCIVKSTT